jgi:predicted DNA-binding WGR domain protein
MMATASSQRRFEYVGGGSDKYWEVRRAGTRVTVHFGRHGTTGQTISKTFADQAATAKHVERLIRQKTGKGYVEVL